MKDHVVKYCKTAFGNLILIPFVLLNHGWSHKNLRCSQVSSFDFSFLYIYLIVTWTYQNKCIVSSKLRFNRESKYYLWHNREQHVCFLPRVTSVKRERRSISHYPYDKRGDFNFSVTNFPFMRSNTSIPYSANYDVKISSHGVTICPSLILIWMQYSHDQSTFRFATQTGIHHGTLEIVIQDVLCSTWGSN